MKIALAMMMMSVLAVACVVNEEDAQPTAVEQPASQEVSAPTETPSETPGQSKLWGACAPGPSANWCVNREGHSCPVAGARSRCFLPNYCEWFVIRCEGGVWVIIG